MSNEKSLESSKINTIILDSFRDLVIEQAKILSITEFEQMIDETIGVYITNTVKQFYQDYEKHSFWLNQNEAVSQSLTEIGSFVEVIDAYLDGFQKIENCVILDWLIELKSKINCQEEEKSCPIAEEKQDFSLSDKNSSLSKKDDNFMKMNNAFAKKDLEESLNDDIRQLTEIFPQFSLKNIKKIYKKNHNDYEATIDGLIMIENDSSDISEEEVYRKNDLSEEDRQLMKERIVQK